MGNVTNVKLLLNQLMTGVGIVGSDSYEISDEGKVRFTIEGADSGNIIVVRGKITGASNWTVLKTMTGPVNEVANVSTYDLIQIEVTTYASTSNSIRVIASSFNEASGSTISIDVDAGDNISDADELIFTSSDSSVTITGNNTTKTIDFTVGVAPSGGYVQSFNATTDWSGPSLGLYSISILAATHGQGIKAVCEVFEGINDVATDLSVDASGNVIIKVSSSPDLRFTGKIHIK